MSLVLESAIPPHHLLPSRSSSWPCPYTSHDYPAPASSPAPMSPQSLQSYMSHMPESPVPSQEIHSLPSSGWYGPSISAPECHTEVGSSVPSLHGLLTCSSRPPTPHSGNICLRILQQPPCLLPHRPLHTRQSLPALLHRLIHFHPRFRLYRSILVTL